MVCVGGSQALIDALQLVTAFYFFRNYLSEHNQAADAAFLLVPGMKFVANVVSVSVCAEKGVFFVADDPAGQTLLVQLQPFGHLAYLGKDIVMATAHNILPLQP